MRVCCVIRNCLMCVSGRCTLNSYNIWLKDALTMFEFRTTRSRKLVASFQLSKTNQKSISTSGLSSPEQKFRRHFFQTWRRLFQTAACPAWRAPSAGSPPPPPSLSVCRRCCSAKRRRRSRWRHRRESWCRKLAQVGRCVLSSGT